MSGEDMPEIAGKGGTRKKLWQVECGYHCSLIGTCLSRRDLHAIARRKSSDVRGDADDFAIHQYLSSVAAQRSGQSRSLHKMLDRKYALAVKRYSGCRDDEAIAALWEQDLAAGRVAGAYWAIMTNSCCSARLLDRVYGDCHMLSFELFASQCEENRKVQRLSAKLSRAEVLAQERLQQLVDERQRSTQLTVALQQEQVCKVELETKVEQLVCKNKQLQELVAADVPAELALLRAEIGRLQRQNEALQEGNMQLAEREQALKKHVTRSNREVEKQQECTRLVLAENTNLYEELAAIEAMLGGENLASPCAECAEEGSTMCHGPDLCGKTILYVGGRHGMVSRYRQLVEKSGGTFLHHDGGRENSRQLLPKLLTGADAVVCPIDCVSHDACNRVKRVCKRYQKPFVMMRSSGLSSLARGLAMIEV